MRPGIVIRGRGITLAGEVSAATPSLTPALAEAELRELWRDSWLPARLGCDVMRVVRVVVVVVVDVWPPSRATLCSGANRPCRAGHRKYLHPSRDRTPAGQHTPPP